jgi:hypothetical protein
MNDISIAFLSMFGLMAGIFFIGYLLAPKERFLKPLENKKGSTVYRLNGFGTCMHGWKVLDEEQLKYYGLEQFEHEGKMYWPLAKFKTIFVALLWIPFIPLKTQIIIDKGDGSFYAFPVEFYRKQAFGVLFISYFIIFIILCFLLR